MSAHLADQDILLCESDACRFGCTTGMPVSIVLLVGFVADRSTLRRILQTPAGIDVEPRGRWRLDVTRQGDAVVLGGRQCSPLSMAPRSPSGGQIGRLEEEVCRSMGRYTWNGRELHRER
jgi:hypothetical protein